MSGRLLNVLAVAILLSVSGVQAAWADWRQRHVVHGVEEGDMLKLRAGPGTGFIVIAGLPNGSVVRVHGCDQTGGTRWCKVALDRAPRLKGYVSSAYLKER